MDYCENLEKALCPDAELRGVMLHWRSKIREHGLNRILSTRAMVKAYKCKQRLGWAMKKVADRFFAGWPADEREKVESR